MEGKEFDRVYLMVIDGVGCGEANDAKDRYPEDAGANSLVNASKVTPLDTPAMAGMGIEYVPGCEGIVMNQHVKRADVRGAFGALEPTFNGKGSPEGHMALCGLTDFAPYLYFDKTGFPPELVQRIEEVAAEVVRKKVKAVRYPGTDDISGTVFIEHPDIFGPHLASKGSRILNLPIYASADSLVQIVGHYDVIPQTMLEDIGKAVRRMLDREGWRVARVILRPFVGEPGSFKRVGHGRRDYGVNPDGPTLTNHLTDAGIPVNGIGKFPDMLNFSGFPEGSCQKLHDDQERVREVLRRVREEVHDGFVAINFIGGDELFGHRRDPRGYVGHLNEMDGMLGKMSRLMTRRDLLLWTSDHGCDPTKENHTNHTRERPPLIAYTPGMTGPVDLGVRRTYADVAKAIGENYGVAHLIRGGESFLDRIANARQ